MSPIDLYLDRYDHFKKQVEKIYTSDIYANIWVWNLQSLNKQYKARTVKIDFIKDVINNTRIDMIYLIDVNNYRETILLNNYTKYDDGRNLLFVANDIQDTFVVDKKKMIIFNEKEKLMFTYLTPNTDKDDQIKEVKTRYEEGFRIFADFNYKSNSTKFCNFIKEFSGEDSMQIGLIGDKPKRMSSMTGPSDHNAIMYTIKVQASYALPLRVTEISVENSKRNVKKILKGYDGDYRPNVKILQRRCNYNDGEVVIDRMLSDYIENNIEPVYRKYNYLWKFNKKEPFLGTKCPARVVETFAKHLKEVPNKKYEEVIEASEHNWIETATPIKFTKSKALTNEYFSLGSIPEAINETLKERKEKGVEKDGEIIKNVLSLINKHKDNLIANTFFLVKKPKLEDFNDVRMIVIIPTFIKIYETLIFNDVVRYLSEVIHEKGKYQYGGVLGGSTYDAIYATRERYMKFRCKGLLLMDMSKGYDTVNLQKLEGYIKGIPKDRIRTLLHNWTVMVKNLNIRMNDKIVYKTRGLPMGLSLAPIVFTYYVHQVLRNLDAEKMVMYIDDLNLLFPYDWTGQHCLEHANMVIKLMEDNELVINKQKTNLVSNDQELISFFKPYFSITSEDKYLGREIGINGDGYLVADDRFYKLNSYRVKACPNFNLFGISRLLFISALDAKNRYRFMCWSCNTQSIRGAVFKNSWFFFKGTNDHFSYIQMMYSTFNVFRYFIDSLEVQKIWEDIDNGITKDFLLREIKEKIKVGITQIDAAIDEIVWPKAKRDDNKLWQGKLFMDDIFEQIKKIMLSQYIDKKKSENILTYYDIWNIVKTKFYINFRIVQNLAFNHQHRTVDMQLIIFEVCDALLECLKKAVIINNNKVDVLEEVEPMLTGNFKFGDLKVISNIEQEEQRRKFFTAWNMKLWALLDYLVVLDKVKKASGKKQDRFLKVYKFVFKTLTVLEALTANRNLKGLCLEILEYLFLAKCFQNDNLTEKFYHLVEGRQEIEIWDHDILG